MAAEVCDLVFVRLAHVEDEEGFSGIETALQFFGLNISGHRRFRAAHAAELLIVNEFLNCSICPADRAVGILAQLQLLELHAERIDQQHASDQRLTDSADELDDFRRLDHSEQPGKYAPDAPFRA